MCEMDDEWEKCEGSGDEVILYDKRPFMLARAARNLACSPA